jgi:Tfp pilus assembly protein PilF
MKSLFYVTGLSLLLTMGCSPDSPVEMASKAEQHYQQGQYAQAVKSFQDLQKEHGATPENWQNIAVAALQSQDFSYAARAAQEGLHLLATSSEASETKVARQDALTEVLAMAREREGNLEEAIQLYYDLTYAQTKAVRISAKSRLANLFLEKEKEDAALAFLLSALKDDATSGLTNYNLAKLCTETLKLYSKGLDFYHMAQRMLPEAAAQKRIAAAEIARLEANPEELRPTPPEKGNATKCKKAMADYEKAKQGKRFKTAESFAKTALKEDPSNYQAAINLITIAKQNKQPTLALETYHHALLIQPNDLDLRVKAATFALEIKRYEDAMTFLRPVVVANVPKYRSSIYQMMTLLVKKNKRDAARAWGEYYLTVAPDTPERNRTFIKGLPTYVK